MRISCLVLSVLSCMKIPMPAFLDLLPLVSCSRCICVYPYTIRRSLVVYGRCWLRPCRWIGGVVLLIFKGESSDSVWRSRSSC
uniref:Secreted protein n=1 Tax=Setaria viridis TaxID=4556 RepID=A0A4U6VPK6_SETVI|nr:hypothetical protein SEVIR_3G412032v2 [Setaria viridis]